MGNRIGPNPGRQEQFLSAWVDFALYGGAYGAGKSFALLLDPLRWIRTPNFNGVIFRRTHPELIQKGGLWDTSVKIYPYAGGRGVYHRTDWVFGNGVSIQLRMLDTLTKHLSWKGSEICYLAFDQLETFAWEQFHFMWSRNRSTCGVVPYVRASCNPDPDHWLREFLRPYIDDDTGYAREDMAGKVMFFKFKDRPGEVDWSRVPRTGYSSFTFIPAKLEDNPVLRAEDPNYEKKLEGLTPVEYERGRKGNWNIRLSAGSFFQRDWFKIVEAAPRLQRVARYWDRASTAREKATKRSSWTAGVKGGMSFEDQLFIVHVARDQRDPLGVEELMRNTAEQDGLRVQQWLEQDPGQAGVAEVKGHIRRTLKGFNVHVNPVHENKGLRALPVAAQSKAGNVLLVRGQEGGIWIPAFLNEAENFDGTDKCISDQMDGLSGLYHVLNNVKVAGAWGTKR